MTTRLRVAALMFAALTAPAALAAGPSLHDDPAPGDNLRIYTITEAPTATLALDGASSAIDGKSVMFTQLRPGAHAATLTLPDGSRASLDFTLSADALIESKGRRWWCLSTGRRNGALTMLQLTPVQCKTIADLGPD